MASEAAAGSISNPKAEYGGRRTLAVQVAGQGLLNPRTATVPRQARIDDVFRLTHAIIALRFDVLREKAGDKGTLQARSG
jgi:hypothetical protein